MKLHPHLLIHLLKFLPEQKNNKLKSRRLLNLLLLRVPQKNKKIRRETKNKKLSIEQNKLKNHKQCRKKKRLLQLKKLPKRKTVERKNLKIKNQLLKKLTLNRAHLKTTTMVLKLKRFKNDIKIQKSNFLKLILSQLYLQRTNNASVIWSRSRFKNMSSYKANIKKCKTKELACHR